MGVAPFLARARARGGAVSRGGSRFTRVKESSTRSSIVMIMNGGGTFPCPTCGAHLPVDGSTQTPRCAYCGTEVLLPVEIWTRFHPLPPPTIPLANRSPAPKGSAKAQVGASTVGVLVAVALVVGAAVIGAKATPSSTPYAKAGDACEGRRAACSIDKKADLVCGSSDRFVVANTCKGPGGCQVKPDGKKIACDSTLADPNDPCDIEDDACTVDHQSEVRCVGGRFVVVSSCKGPSGCRLTDKSGGGKVLSCDDHVADVGDPCFDSARTACSVDGRRYLTCVGQRFVVANVCAGKSGCKATHVVGTDETRMECDRPK